MSQNEKEPKKKKRRLSDNIRDVLTRKRQAEEIDELYRDLFRPKKDKKNS
jgi:hypothetical protein